MDNPRGRVLSLMPGDNGARAIVAVQSAAACPRCAAGKGCGAGMLASGGAREVEATIREGLRPEVDDVVELSIAPDTLLSAALNVYIPPLIGAVAFALLSYGLKLGDGAAAGLALLGLGAGVMASRWRLRRAGCLRRFTPRIERLC